MNGQQNKKTILVVEDDTLNMKLSADLLELNGFDVLKAVDGERMLEILKGRRPDLILLDMQLPGINGFEVFKKIRKNKQFDSIKVIALSASVMKEDEDKIRKAGFDAYISKPINTKNFIKEVKEILSRKKAEDKFR